MASSPTVLDSDFRYIDKKGKLMKTRKELTIAQMLAFLEKNYEYNYELSINGKIVMVDFKTENGLIEVIDSDDDIKKYKEIKEHSPDTKIMAIGHPKFAAQISELDDIVFYDKKSPQTGSIFIEDPSFAFDYAHILPLVEKCSILHGHTSSVMVELVGQMKNDMLIDFSDAKKIIKEVITILDHKFFINRKYLKDEDDSHFRIVFEGIKVMFDLKIPKNTTYLLVGDATVDYLITALIKILAPKLPPNVEAIGVYIYEGFNKGAHIIAKLDKQ